MKRLRHFAGEKVPDPLALYQLTVNPELPACHVYMEAQIFTPDSGRFVLHESAHPHGSDPRDPRHRYLLCDLNAGGDLTPLTEECGVTAPSLSPDGKIFYYFVDELERRGRLRLRKMELSTGERTEVASLSGQDGIAPTAPFYPLSTISSDGRRIAIATALRSGPEADWPEHGMWVFDTETGECRLVLRGTDFCNLHLQYCRSEREAHTILIQHNHGSRLRSVCGKREGISHAAALDAGSGHALRKIRACDDPLQPDTGYGIDLHLIADDGTQWRSLPVGRDGVEFCQGHQCWRGTTSKVIASTLLFRTPGTANQELIELEAFPGAVHCLPAAAGGVRNVLSRGITPPHFLHFATDIAGMRIVSDYEADNGEWHLYAGQLGGDGEAADLRFLLNLGSREKSPWHPHPFLSPNGQWAFFNSSASGQLQAYGLRLPRETAS